MFSYLIIVPLNVSSVGAEVLPVWNVVGHQKIFGDRLIMAHGYGAWRMAGS